MKKAVVLGAGGFIGSHMVKRLKKEGFQVTGVDLKKPEYSETQADFFVVGDLRGCASGSFECECIDVNDPSLGLDCERGNIP